MQKRKWAKVLGVALLSIGLTVVLCLAAAHLLLLGSCRQLSVRYQQAYQGLQKAVETSAADNSLTQDDVDDAAALVVLKSARQEAEKALKSTKADDIKCGGSFRLLRDAYQDNTQTVNKLNRLISLDHALETAKSTVDASHEAKQLADARAALKSTILSMAELKKNALVSAEIKTQIDRAVASARQVLATGDVDDLKQARTQLENVVNQVNDSINRSNQEILNTESAVRGVATAASGGSYVESALNIIHAAGMSETWGLERMNGACKITDEQAASWLAAYCEATPSTVYINNTLGADVMSDSYFADAMRHEVAHHLIDRRCGTTSPASIGSGANAESVASSYAVLYLGANPSTLNRAVDDRYHMTTESDNAAARVHAGQCS